MQLTENFYKILNTKTCQWFATKNSKASWSRLSGAKTAFSANNLDENIYEIYEFVGVGKPLKAKENG